MCLFLVKIWKIIVISRYVLKIKDLRKKIVWGYILFKLNLFVRYLIFRLLFV